jgi:hypothetical protein
MAFNAAEFRSKMRYGGARPNLYEVGAVPIIIPGKLAERHINVKISEASPRSDGNDNVTS